MAVGFQSKIGLVQSKVSPEDFEKLLHHSYLIASEAQTKIGFFKQSNSKVSSTLLLLEMLKNWGHPVTKTRFGCQKKGKFANNLLLLEVDNSWNQNFVRHEDIKYKTFADWGAHAVHVSDLLCFRPNFFNKFSLSTLELCYDNIDEEILRLEFWRQ